VKECPKCQTLVRLPVMLCPECGYEFPRKEKERREHEDTASNCGVISGETTVEEFEVKHTDYQVWEKRGAAPDAPKTVRVTYYLDMIRAYSEWLCPEHHGYARSKFERWWREHARPECPVPLKAEDVCEHFFAGMVRETKRISVRFTAGQRYPEIVGYELGDFSEGREDVPGIENEDDVDIDDLPF